MIVCTRCTSTSLDCRGLWCFCCCRWASAEHMDWTRWLVIWIAHTNGIYQWKVVLGYKGQLIDAHMTSVLALLVQSDPHTHTHTKPELIVRHIQFESLLSSTVMVSNNNIAKTKIKLASTSFDKVAELNTNCSVDTLLPRRFSQEKRTCSTLLGCVCVLAQQLCMHALAVSRWINTLLRS